MLLRRILAFSYNPMWENIFITRSISVILLKSDLTNYIRPVLAKKYTKINKYIDCKENKENHRRDLQKITNYLISI